MLALVKSLLDTWHSNDVLYCHWKSNEAINRGLEGEGDLDILLSQQHMAKAYETLTKLGFKRLIERPHKAYPGIEHWLGLSIQEGVFVHVHLHFRLVYGEKFIKGHRFSNEKELLQRRILSNGIYQISREDELVFLFIRSILKIDFIWILKKLAGLEKNYLPLLIFKEYQFLLNEISEERVKQIKDDFIPSIDFDSMLYAIKHIDQLSLFKVMRWKHRIFKSLYMSRRLSRLAHATTFLRVYVGFGLIKMGILKKPKKRLFTGGTTIALLGADGAGKSTMLKELNSWIGQYLDVEIRYTGSGDGSKSFALTLFDYINSLRKKHHNSPKADPPNSDSSVGYLKTCLKNIRAILVAKHRLSTISNARLQSNNGKIVLYDRYPQPFNRDYSDGPKVIVNGGVLSKWLYKWELEIYEKLYSYFPDYCICLMVDPEVSVSRKGEDSEDTIRKKNTVLETLLDMNKANSSIVDANQDYENVLLQLKELAWKNL